MNRQFRFPALMSGLFLCTLMLVAGLAWAQSSECISGCLTGDALGDTTIEVLQTGYDGVPLQDVFTAAGIALNVTTDQSQNQIWQLNSTETTIQVDFIDNIAAHPSVFGYYEAGDLGSFVPLFTVQGYTNATHPEYPLVPVRAHGSSAIYDISGETIGFAINSYNPQTNTSKFYATENSLNTAGYDHAVAYYDCSDLILGFEDLSIDGSDAIATDLDYQDAVVRIRALACGGIEIPVNTVSGMKFHDLNGNGAKDADEPGLANWTITLSGTDSLITTVTDDAGQYTFTGVLDGAYTICENAPTAWTQTYPSSGPICADGTHGHDITLANGSSASDQDFGNTQDLGQAAGSISGIKYHDVNGNGQRDSGEPPLEDWTIFIDANANGALDVDEISTQTAAGGIFQFAGLADGMYRISEVQQGGWMQTTGAFSANISAGSSVENVEIGNALIACLNIISGIKFEDINGNGIRDAGEPGLAGWTIYMDSNNNGQLDANETYAVTDATGRYHFFLPFGGTIIVREVLQADWDQTMAPSAITVGGNVHGVDFGNVYVAPLNMISGVKFHDSNGNGVKDANETGLSGWIITLNSTAGAVSTVTDGNGTYAFTGLADGTYVVCEVIQSGWTQTMPATGATCADGSRGYSVAVSDSASATDKDFGNVRYGSISGVKFLDENANGIRDAQEIGLANWTMYLDANSNGIKDAGEVSTTTDVNGTYQFSNLPPGTYRVREMVQLGWHQVTANPAPIELSGNAVSGINFGNAIITCPALITGMKFHDLNANGVRDAGEPGLANWTIYIDANNNGALDAGELSTTTDASGRYQFVGLATGSTVVREVQQQNWVQTTPNPAPIPIGGSTFDANFGNQPSTGSVVTGSISGLKFKDLNSNGIRDVNLPSDTVLTTTLSGSIAVPVADTNATGNATATAVVTLDGTHLAVTGSFSGLSSDLMPIEGTPAHIHAGALGTAGPIALYLNVTTNEDNHSGTFTFSGTLTPEQVILFRSGEFYVNIHTMNFMTGELRGQFPASTQANTTAEPGLSGWTIYLDMNGNGALDSGEPTTVTDSAGQYTFGGLTGGSYTVREVQQSGWVQTTANPAAIAVNGNDVVDIRFGNRPEVVVPVNSVSGMKWHDLNGNGQKDAGEPGLVGWTITLAGNDMNVSTGTDANGNYAFTGLADGTYTICEVLQSGWTQTYPTAGPNCPAAYKAHVVTVTNGSGVTGADFGNVRFGTISGVKFHDLNGNGVRDLSEPGLAGWTIYLDLNDNSALDGGEPSATTDANGNYFFANLVAGTYQVREVQQSGWEQSSATPAALAINGNDAPYVHFGNKMAEVPLNSISGVKFNDLNGDGVWDENEPGLANWTITLSGTNLSVSTMTDGDGMYEFTGLADGTYMVCETLQAGWMQTFPTTGANCSGGTMGHDLTVADSGSFINNNFGNRLIPVVPVPATLVIIKQSVGGAGTFSFTGDVNLTLTTTIDASANATLSLAAGTYAIAEVGQSGWELSSAVCSDGSSPSAIVLSEGEIVICTFVNTQVLGSISGVKFDDANGNGVRDSGEAGLMGVTIFIDANANGILDSGEVSVVTDANGSYTISNLIAGSFTVREVAQAGWMQTTANPAALVVSGNAVVDVDFGNRQILGSISGMKFQDMNGNGVRDEGEPVLAGWTITLSGDANGTTTTDENGSYTFSDLSAGSYLVCEILQSGWTQTYPTFGPSCPAAYKGHPVDLGDGEAVTDKDFGNVRYGSISGKKFNDMNGNGVREGTEPGLAGWTIYLDMNGNGTLDGGEPSAVTDANGNFFFANLIAGTYTVREVGQTDWVQVTANPDAIVINGNDVRYVNFGNQVVARTNVVTGMKWHDLNGNGQKDAGEPGLANWTITLNGTASASTQTDGNGMYAFTGLVDGTYTICEVLQSGWSQTFPTTGPNCPAAYKAHVVAVSNGTNATADFGNVRFGSISGKKFNDLNGNGIQDSGEVGLAGWVIYLDMNNNSVLDSGEMSTATDSNGNYFFATLVAGTYQVREVQQSGWMQTSATPAPLAINGSDVLYVNFGNQQVQPGSISGMKFHDVNGNGAKDVGEVGLAGWVIYLDLNGNGTMDSGEPTATTDANGTYSFSGIMPATYTVRESLQAGWVQTAQPGAVTLASGATVTNVDLGNRRILGSISGMKFQDLNGNGVRDEGEPALAGWTITLSGGANATTTTDANGSYIFADLNANSYVVCEILQSGWTQTYPTSGPNCPAAYKGHPVQLGDGQQVTGQDFGNVRFGSMSGKKFNDVNGNGVRDSSEPGLAGWTIYLDLNNNSAHDTGEPTATTDANGNFFFANLVAGTYLVREVQQEGWMQITANPGPIDINGNAVLYINFGNQVVVPLNSVSGAKYNDQNGNGARDAGEAGLPGWTITLTGTNLSVSTVTDANGSYAFTGLADGTYTICEVLQSGWTQTYPASGPNCPSGYKAHVVAVSNGASTTGMDFGNSHFGAISGMKFHDVNANGGIDFGDAGVAGWTIYLDANANGALDSGEVSAITDANGNYLFANLVPGTYLVREVQQFGWIQSTPNPPAVVINGNTVPLVNFGNQRLNGISGMKFQDMNANGIHDENEPGIAGWTIYIDQNSNNVFEEIEPHVLTDANGTYTFNGLGSGTYTIREVDQPGWQRSSQNPAPIEFTMMDINGVTIGEVNFGNILVSCPND